MTLQRCPITGVTVGAALSLPIWAAIAALVASLR